MPGEVVQANGARSRVKLDSGVEFEAATAIADGERIHAIVRPEKLLITTADEQAPVERAKRRGSRPELGLSGDGDADRRQAGG